MSGYCQDASPRPLWSRASGLRAAMTGRCHGRLCRVRRGRPRCPVCLMLGGRKRRKTVLRKAATISMRPALRPFAKNKMSAMSSTISSRSGGRERDPAVHVHSREMSGRVCRRKDQPVMTANSRTWNTTRTRASPTRHMRGTEFGDVEVFVRSPSVAHKMRHQNNFAWIIEDKKRPAAIPHWEPMYEVDFHGRGAVERPSRGRVKNEPSTALWPRGLVEALCAFVRNRRRHVGFGMTGRTVQCARRLSQRRENRSRP